MNHDDLPNSVVPATISALVAEEWTIDPYSPMPSFLERVFMKEAQDSAYRGIEIAHDYLMDRFERCALSFVRQRSDTNVELVGWIEKLLDRVREAVQRVLRKIASIMRQNRLALICLSIYTIERTVLEKSSCTLAESFYGGHRVKLSTTTNQDGKGRSTTPLETKDKVRLAGILALSVFVKGKLEAFYHYLKGHERILSDEKRLFVTVYPWIRTACQSISFLCRWNYLLGLSPFFDVPSVLLQQWLRRVSRSDSPNINSTSTPSNPDQNNSGVIQRASIATTALLLVSWLSWCRSTWAQIAQEQDKSKAIPPPPPPATTGSVKRGCCCLCGTNPPKKPTACTVSGFVGCGACMEGYLAKYSCCPITKYVCTPTSFVRLYEPRS